MESKELLNPSGEDVSKNFDMTDIQSETSQIIEDVQDNSPERHDEYNVDENYIKECDKNLSEEELQSRKLNAERLKKEGNESFQLKDYTKAAEIYTLALKTCPLIFSQDRSVLYANRAACFIYMDKTKNGIEDCNRSLEIVPHYLKALSRRALLYEKDEKLDEALEDYKKVLEIDSKNSNAIEACMRLPSMINERNEKLKTEMLSKLKDLGNLVLRPFGLSTENFNLQKDPSTGSYSVNFQQNK